MTAKSSRIRLANTLTNLAYPLAGITRLLLAGGKWGWAWFLSTLLLGIFSGFWHWLFYPYNRLDRYAMYLVLCALLAQLVDLFMLWPFLSAILVVLDLGVEWIEYHSFYVIACLSSSILIAVLAGYGWLPAAGAAAILLVALLISETDDTPDRTGAVHVVWHILTAGGLLYIFLIPHLV